MLKDWLKRVLQLFRYDKRVIAQINKATVQEEKMTFEDEVNDALLVVNHFKDKYKKIILIGHSEGALVGLLVAQKVVVSKFVSISGAGNSSATLIEEQIGKNAPQLKEESQKIISQLRKGELVENISPYLAPVFQGTNDLQVEDKEAQLLKEAQPKAQLLLIEGMNHVLKKVKTLVENQQSYLNPDLPISGELVEGIASFIK